MLESVLEAIRLGLMGSVDGFLCSRSTLRELVDGSSDNVGRFFDRRVLVSVAVWSSSFCLASELKSVLVADVTFAVVASRLVVGPKGRMCTILESFFCSSTTPTIVEGGRVCWWPEDVLCPVCCCWALLFVLMMNECVAKTLNGGLAILRGIKH